ncbi:hypothetical protein PsorP6_003732 [Peronosclerospora sorghi]|uniref:Uncharacterized protein n=1 Tax=Peronosclerospora sorghi TaxID=230839 RepID=A0ACC0VNS9_9STRA|nr:hypothetical protein PsorP6_003732 [Peronosclerospora sorghi]
MTRGRSHKLRYRTNRDISFEGYLIKKSDVHMSWNATYFVLEEDTITFYETREDFISNTKLIGRSQLQTIEDEYIGKDNGLCLVAEGNRYYHLSSRTAFEKEQWKRAIIIAVSKAPEDYATNFWSVAGPQWPPTTLLHPLNPMCRPLAKVSTTTGQLYEGEVLRVQRGESILQVFHPNATICNVQVCRSVSMWPAGVPTEASIQAAYMDLIAKSKNFLYIENPFFVSGMDGNGIERNRILQAFVECIELAVHRDERFRVYLVIPLLPAFEGNIRSHELTNLHAVMHWQFATICSGRYSLFKALKGVTDHPETT